MARIGMNPNRGQVGTYHPARVTVAILTYLPDEETGYFRNRFDVIRLSIESVLANTPEPFDLLVFDNGSCKHLVDYLRGLRDEGRIDYLILSPRNVGKIGAFQIMFQAAPGELIAYADDDIFYLPGWLERSLQIVEAYPSVGMVSGYYARQQMRYAISATQKFVEQNNVPAQRGRLMLKEWEEHFIEGYGRDYETYMAETKDVEDCLLTYNNISAFVSAQHMQFIVPKAVALTALPSAWGGQLMGQMRELDMAVDELGYLRLSTAAPVTRFLGNMVDEAALALARQYSISVEGVGIPTVRKRRDLWHWLANHSARIRIWTYNFYNYLFEVLNTEK